MYRMEEKGHQAEGKVSMSEASVWLLSGLSGLGDTQGNQASRFPWTVSFRTEALHPWKPQLQYWANQLILLSLFYHL